MLEALLIQMPYYICSLAAFLSAGFCVALAWKRLYPPWLLVGCAAFAALGVAFFLIAATAATGGHVTRGAVAAPIHWLYLSGGVLWCTLLALLVRATVRIERRDST